MKKFKCNEINFLDILGSNIRDNRKSMNLTIEELGNSLDIAPGFLGLIERGKRGTSLNNIWKLAQFFDTTFDGLLIKNEIIKDNKKVGKDENLLKLINNLNQKEYDLVVSIIKKIIYLKYN